MDFEGISAKCQDGARDGQTEWHQANWEGRGVKGV